MRFEDYDFDSEEDDISVNNDISEDDEICDDDDIYDDNDPAPGTYIDGAGVSRKRFGYDRYGNLIDYEANEREPGPKVEPIESFGELLWLLAITMIIGMVVLWICGGMRL